jgi:Bacterial cadherin-like domain
MTISSLFELLRTFLADSFGFATTANEPNSWTYADLGDNGFNINQLNTAANDAPVASPDGFTTDEDGQLNVAAPGVRGNDTDAEGEGDPLNAAPVGGPSNGTLTFAADNARSS